MVPSGLGYRHGPIIACYTEYMSARETSWGKAFIVFVLLVLAGVVITVVLQKPTTQEAKASGTNVNAEFAPTVQPAPQKSGTAQSDVHSSNADKKLIMRITSGKNGMTTYDFFVADISGANERLLYTKTLGSGSGMMLPINAWDPTDTYVFIGEKDGGTPGFFVLKASGEPFANGEKFLDVGAVWTAKKINYSIRDATGWASGTLLIVYTSQEDGSHGPAFWFEVPSTAIIQLAR